MMTYQTSTTIFHTRHGVTFFGTLRLRDNLHNFPVFKRIYIKCVMYINLLLAYHRGMHDILLTLYYTVFFVEFFYITFSVIYT